GERDGEIAKLFVVGQCSDRGRPGERVDAVAVRSQGRSRRKILRDQTEVRGDRATRVDLVRRRRAFDEIQRLILFDLHVEKPLVGVVLYALLAWVVLRNRLELRILLGRVRFHVAAARKSQRRYDCHSEDKIRLHASLTSLPLSSVRV